MYYELEIHGSNRNTDLLIQKELEAAKAPLTHVRLGLWESSQGREVWLGYPETLTELSCQLPEVLFEMTGYGDAEADFWQQYFFRGEMQRCVAEVCTPPLDPSEFTDSEDLRKLMESPPSTPLLEKAAHFLEGPFNKHVCQGILHQSFLITPAERQALKEQLGDYVANLLSARDILDRLRDSLNGRRIPPIAYREALEEGGTDLLRQAACLDAEHAFHFANEIDKAPRDDTRAASLADPQYAYMYALFVDRCPRDDTRASACKIPEQAFLYAQRIDGVPRDDTRLAACASPQYATDYGQKVDGCPRDDTRFAACKDAYWSLYYARNVDKAPSEMTREGAWTDREIGRNYADWEQLLHVL